MNSSSAQLQYSLGSAQVSEIHSITPPSTRTAEISLSGYCLETNLSNTEFRLDPSTGGGFGIPFFDIDMEFDKLLNEDYVRDREE